MLAIDCTLRQLMKTVGVSFTSNVWPRSSDFLILASVSGVAAQAAILWASRPAAVASSFSLSSAVGQADTPLPSQHMPTARPENPRVLLSLPRATFTPPLPPRLDLPPAPTIP